MLVINAELNEHSRQDVDEAQMRTAEGKCLLYPPLSEKALDEQSVAALMGDVILCA